MSVPVGATTCSECGRDKYEHGTAAAIEGAWDAARVAQASEALAKLESSKRRRDQERYAALIDRFQRLAIYGELEPKREWRHLREDLWEIKTPEDRVGAYIEPASRRHVRFFRLTHIFTKQFNKTADGKTPQKQINYGLLIIRKDREHGSTHTP